MGMASRKELEHTKWLVAESNRIEGIYRPPTDDEIREFNRFMALPEVKVADLTIFVGVYQPGAFLRAQPGVDVRVGNHIPPSGGPQILEELDDILYDAQRQHADLQRDAYEVHQAYETLHPFTDGNGRSGRMLWHWMMRRAPLGFLHTWYYQSLAYGGLQ